LSNLNIAVVGIPGKWSTDVLAAAVEARLGRCLVVDMSTVELRLDEGRVLTPGGEDLCTYDGIIIKKIAPNYSPAALDRLEVLRIPESRGVRIFSPPEHILRLVDRLACTVTLTSNEIPIPPTRVTESIDHTLQAINDFGSVVLKPLYSTKARGMAVLDSREGETALREQLQTFHQSNPHIYVQRRIPSLERDMGLAFLGGEFLGAYARVSGKSAWNTTIRAGGKYHRCKPSNEIVRLAQRAQAPFGLDFTTVDIAETSEGPVVFEVSAFGGFRGVLEGAGIDAAAAYADYAIAQLQNS